MKEKVNRETAVMELEKWLESKKISQNKRESLLDVESEIVDAICDGYLHLDEKTMEWKHTLKFPLENLKELTYAHRINVGKVEVKTRTIKPDDLQGRIRAYISVLTGEPNGIISALDTADSSIAGSIASYFF